MPGDLDLLVGTSVVDLGIWRPAPFAAQLLAELGAEVTKVEPPGGDPMRMFPELYRSLNRRKDVVELDLKDGADQERALDLLGGADVVVEGFRPEVADRLGVGYAAVSERNPSVVYASVSGFGQDGPLAALPGHDLNYQAWSGVLGARLPEIDRPGIPLADLAGGVYAALTVSAALVARARTGEGRHLDVSMTDVLVSWAGPAVDGPLAEGEDPARNFPAYGAFPCRDGVVTLGIVTEQPFWAALCEVLGLEDVAGLDATARADDGPGLRQRVATAVADRGRDELVTALLVKGVPVAPVLVGDEVIGSDHARARGLVRTTPDGGVTFRHPVRAERPD